jgi:hypothetical protein
VSRHQRLHARTENRVALVQVVHTRIWKGQNDRVSSPWQHGWNTDGDAPARTVRRAQPPRAARDHTPLARSSGHSTSTTHIVTTQTQEEMQSQLLADEAESILREIATGRAVTCYMHRSPWSDGFSDHRGDIEPHWIAQRGGGQWYGSVFGARGRTHIEHKGDDRAVELSSERARYYCDCAGFVRELISRVFPSRPDGRGPKAALLERAAGDAIDGFARRAYPRANVFGEYFRSCPDATTRGRPASGQPWARVVRPEQLRRGDIVAESFGPGASHTGHIWIVASEPDARGDYMSVESTGDGICSLRRNASQICEGAGRARTVGVGRLMGDGVTLEVSGGARASTPRRATRSRAGARTPSRGRSGTTPSRGRRGTTPSRGRGGTTPQRPVTGRRAHKKVGEQGAVVRSGADLASPELDVLPPGTAIAVLGEPGQERLLIETAAGQERGWVTKKFCTASRDRRGRTWQAGPQGAVLRAGQPLSSEQLRTLRPGDAFRVVAERVRVVADRSDGTQPVTGWASAQFLRD